MLKLVGLSIYAAGVCIGLARADAPPLARVGLALAWPIGALAAAVTVPILLLAAGVLFPLIGLAAAGIALAGWLAFS